MIELSVVVPTIRRHERLRACLAALAAQSLPPASYEVIVVVDGVDRETEEMLARFTAPYALRVCTQENAGPGAARNRGAMDARGEFCLFLDDDMLAERETLAAHVRAQREHAGIIAVGKIALRLPPDADWFACWFERSWRRHYRRLDRRQRPATWQDCYSGNLSAPTEAFRRCGGFATDLVHAEDVELAHRLARQHVPILYVPGAVTVQDERKRVTELLEDAEKAGAASVELCRRHPALIPDLLGSFRSASQAERMCHRLLLAFDAVPRRIAPLGSVVPWRRWTDACGQLLHRYGYWRGVRKAIEDPALWNDVCAGTIRKRLIPAPVPGRD